jgi:hypothetical protein
MSPGFLLGVMFQFLSQRLVLLNTLNQAIVDNVRSAGIDQLGLLTEQAHPRPKHHGHQTKIALALEELQTKLLRD